LSGSRVWLKALWSTMRLYNINANLIRTIQNLYEKAVYLNHTIGEWFTTIALSAYLGGRSISNLRFSDDNDGLAGIENELVNLVNRLNTTSTAYGMEISAPKTKPITNSPGDINSNIKVNN